jgi:biopolymer transport protein ExbB/TolQ
MSDSSSLRPTREWQWFILAVALVGAACVPLWQVYVASQGETGGARWNAGRFARLLLGPEQIACYAAFLWACFLLFSRWMEMMRQRRAFGLDLLPAGQCILAEDARDLQRRIDDRLGRSGPYILASMLRLALGKYAISRNARDVAEIVRTQADLHLGRLVSTMATIHYLAWAIPAIGFLGTVRGLAGAMPGDDIKGEAVEVFMAEVTKHLNVAFDCTLIALALSLVLMFLVHSQQRREEELVLDCQQYCLDHLVSRLYDDPYTEGDPASTTARGYVS